MRTHELGIIAVSALVTMLIRGFPFIFFNGKHGAPRILSFLSGVLPYAVMGMLVVYCFRKADPARMSSFLPSLVSGAAVVISYIWKKNTLISIIAGTILYMFLVQTVF